MAQKAPQFVRNGVRLAGVSPDSAAATAVLRRTLGDDFALYTDRDRRVSALCGTAGSHCIFVLDREGVVRWSGFDENWRVLTDSKALLQAAWRLR